MKQLKTPDDVTSIQIYIIILYDKKIYIYFNANKIYFTLLYNKKYKNDPHGFLGS